MKNIIIFLLLVACGSMFYYYVLYLPKHALIINIQPPTPVTPAQQEAQKKQTQQLIEQNNKKIHDYRVCEKDMNDKESLWLEKRCPTTSGDYLKQMDCRSKALTSSEVKQFECPRSF